MGCAPTAQRLSKIPSNNVFASSKSTKSTMKNTFSVLSPQKVKFKHQDQYVKSNKQRFYSPRVIKKSSQEEGQFKPMKLKNKFSDEIIILKKNKNFEEFDQQNTNQIDIVSHLSLSSYKSTKEDNNQIINTPEKKYPVTEKIIIRKQVSDEKKIENTANQPSQNIKKTPKILRQNSKRLLEAQLRSINNEKFQRVDIQKMHF